MVLKEAYRYQNYLNSLINEAQSYLYKRDFITTTKQTHNRKNVNSDAEDEEIEVQKPYNVDFEPVDVIDFIVVAINEKQKLSDAIVLAKKSTDIDIDSAIAINKIKQGYVSILNSMAATKSSERITTGRGYKFNADGEQTSYCYDVSEVVSIDYDRKNVRELAKKYKKDTDEVSTQLDKIEITTEVSYVPIWDIGDSLDEVVLA